MNEDYLWDKTGAVDPEIERLENALAAFRYRETAPPRVFDEILPTAALPFGRRPSRRIFPLLAAAACVVFMLIGAGVFLRQISNDNIETANETAQTQASKFAKTAETIAPTATGNTASDIQTAIAATNNPTVKNMKAVDNKKSETSVKKSDAHKPNGEKTFAAVYKIVGTPLSRKSQTAALNKPVEPKTENQTVRLTADEQYAYSQLLLALSITNSKLALVKDKLENVREQTAVIKDGR